MSPYLFHEWFLTEPVLWMPNTVNQNQDHMIAMVEFILKHGISPPFNLFFVSYVLFIFSSIILSFWYGGMNVLYHLM